ncbi:MAG: signal peptidase II [Sphingomicrobium sp.]
MHSKRLIGFIVAFVVLAFDQFSKWLVTGPLGINEYGAQLHLLPFFGFTYTRNYGISGGFLHATTDTIRWALVGMTAAIAIGVAFWITREKERWDQVALGMVLGGALGNILDRSRIGYVVDFADLHVSWWPRQICPMFKDGLCNPFLIFNVGDAAISIGVVILLLRGFLLKKDERTEENEQHA